MQAFAAILVVFIFPKFLQQHLNTVVMVIKMLLPAITNTSKSPVVTFQQ